MPVLVHCDACGNDIRKSPSLVRDHNFCGDSCYRLWRKTRTGEENPNWRGGLIALKCESCQRPFSVTPAVAETRRHCSVECKADSQRSKNTCLECGNVFGGSTRQSFCCYECYYAYRQQHPEMNPLWQGGKRASPYARGWSREGDRRTALERDEYRCRTCGKPHSGPRTLYRHHIDGTKSNHALSNIAMLCAVCHQLVHQGKLVLLPAETA